MKHIRTCSVSGCKKTGETQRSYWFCAEHWCMMKWFAICGDGKADYMLRHASHGKLNQYWETIDKELSQLKSEIG